MSIFSDSERLGSRQTAIAAPHIGIMICCYRQACAKRSHAGIVFTQWSKFQKWVFRPTGATRCPDKREI